MDISDATGVLTYYAQMGASLNPVFYEDESKDMLAHYAADVNRDDVINIADATMILQYYAMYAASLNPDWAEL